MLTFPKLRKCRKDFENCYVFLKDARCAIMTDFPIILSSVFDQIPSESKQELLATFVLKPATTITPPMKLPRNVKQSIHHAPMPNLDTLPEELILEIASYFLDRYIFDKLYLGSKFTSFFKDVPRPGEPEIPYVLIRPYIAMAMVCRRLWNVLPKQLTRPIPLEIVEMVELCRQESNWARPFAKERGWGYVAL